MPSTVGGIASGSADCIACVWSAEGVCERMLGGWTHESWDGSALPQLVPKNAEWTGHTSAVTCLCVLECGRIVTGNT